jgi:hypothetical protein
MRWGVGLALAAALAGCTGEKPDMVARLGCGPVNGVGQITGERSHAYVIIGEPVATNEAPAAFAELACRLAARQPKDQPLWVGLPKYLGDTSDAERAMRERLRELVAKGAPMVLGVASDGHTVGASRREEAEQRWADVILANMKSAGAGRALLLLTKADGVAEPVTAADESYLDYTPMALFLPEGQVMNFEIGQATGVGAPTIRIYTKMSDGYMGQIALDSVTPTQRTSIGYTPD